jgi:hypothetical protein
LGPRRVVVEALAMTLRNPSKPLTAEQAIIAHASEIYDRKVRQFAERYDRRDLASMGISVWNPLDYSVGNTELIICKLELALENLNAAPNHWTVHINPVLLRIELEAALYRERQHLKQEKAA